MRRNLADPDYQNEQKKLEKEQERLMCEDIKFILNTKQGRRFYYRYLEFTGYFRLSFTQDPCSTAFNEGMRNVGCRMFADISNYAPEKFQQMMKESKQRDKDE